MEPSKAAQIKWYAILGGAFSLIAVIWLAITPSLSEKPVLLSFSAPRLILIGLTFLSFLAFTGLFFLSKKTRVLLRFKRAMESRGLFLAHIILLTAGLVAMLAVFLRLAGKWSMLLERLLPLFFLLFLVALEGVFFQVILSRGKIRLPAPLDRYQPILHLEQGHPTVPLKKCWPFYALLVAMPALLTLLLVSAQGDKLDNFHPAEIDEIVYQQEIATFKEFGFRGGYFSIDELVSKAGFSPFGAHGPVYAFFFGSLGKIVGWQMNSGPFFNLVVLCLSLAAFLWLIKPDRKQTIFLILLLGLFWPLLYYIPSVMQESLHYALAILISGFLIRLSRDENSPLRIKIAALAVLIFASTLRLTWVIAAFPMFCLFPARRNRGNIAFSLAAASLFSVGMAWLYTWWAGAYQVGFLYVLLRQNSLSSMFPVLVDHFIENIGLYFRSTTITKLEIFFHYQFLFLLVIYLINRFEKKGLARSNLFILAAPLFLTLLLYDVFDLRDFRSLAPFLLIGVVSMAFFSYRGLFRWILNAYLLASLLAAGAFHQLYSTSLSTHFSVNAFPMEQEFAQTVKNLQWQEGKPRWCNSILASYPFYNEVRLLPAGIGLNLMLTEPESLKVKSHYVFVSKMIYDRNPSLATCRALVENTDRVICVRMDDGCDQQE